MIIVFMVLFVVVLELVVYFLWPKEPTNTAYKSKHRHSSNTITKEGDTGSWFIFNIETDSTVTKDVI